MAERLHSERVINHLHAQMRALRVSQSRVADQLGVSQAAVSRRLVGDVPLSLAEFEVIADLLGADPVELYAEAVNA